MENTAPTPSVPSRSCHGQTDWRKTEWLGRKTIEENSAPVMPSATGGSRTRTSSESVGRSHCCGGCAAGLSGSGQLPSPKPGRCWTLQGKPHPWPKRAAVWELLTTKWWVFILLLGLFAIWRLTDGSRPHKVEAAQRGEPVEMIGSIRFFAGLGLLLLAVGLIYRKGKKDAEAVVELEQAKKKDCEGRAPTKGS